MSVALNLAVIATLADVLGTQRAEAAEGSGVLSNTFDLSDAITDTDVGALTAPEYRWNNQRAHWWNGHRNLWDGILPTGSPPADEQSQWWIWKDPGGAPTSDRVAETRPQNTPDCWWDGDASTLYCFFSRGTSGTSRFRRFVYDDVTDAYTEDSAGGGVAAPTDLRGGGRATIVKSPNGLLWAGVTHGGDILVSRSTDGGDSWPEPVAIKATDAGGLPLGAT